MNILEKIIANKRQEVARQKEAVSIDMMRKIIEEQRYGKRSFRQSLLRSSSGIIAEFKRKSPSKGWISEQADVNKIPAEYEKAGASAISVLTDNLFFGGSFDDFKAARNTVDIPLLRKDFIVDEYQLYQSKAMGADVILLIASALTPDETFKLSALAHELDMEVLLEIHNEAELAYISGVIDVVGINNRNLSTFITDVQYSFDLASKIPDSYVKISESGLSDIQTIKLLRAAGFKGFLMGENFMKAPEPGEALKEFICGMDRV